MRVMQGCADPEVVYDLGRTTVHQPTGCPYIEAEFVPVKSKLYSALWDSGASHSCIHKSVFDDVVAATGEMPLADAATVFGTQNVSGFKIRIADNRTIQPCGAVRLTIGFRDLNGKRVLMKMPFLVMDELAGDVILGDDWTMAAAAIRNPLALTVGLCLTPHARDALHSYVRATTVDRNSGIPLPAAAFSHRIAYTIGDVNGNPIAIQPTQPVATKMAVLRTMQSIVIPARSEIGPVATSVNGKAVAGKS